jgi:hypothetical protein
MRYAARFGLGGGEHEQQGVWAPPGRYTISLLIDGRTFRQPLELRPDPRIRVDAEDYTREFVLARKIEQARSLLHACLRDAKAARDRLTRLKATAPPPRQAQLSELLAMLTAIADLPPDDPRSSVPAEARVSGTLQDLSDAFDKLAEAVDGADGGATPDVESGMTQRERILIASLRDWKNLQSRINSALARRP